MPEISLVCALENMQDTDNRHILPSSYRIRLLRMYREVGLKLTDEPSLAHPFIDLKVSLTVIESLGRYCALRTGTIVKDKSKERA